MSESVVYWREDDLSRRLHRIEGQIRGVETMIQRKDACRAILTQIAAAQGALDKVARIVEACSVAEGLLEVDDAHNLDTETVRKILNDLITGQ
ncbi:MAG: metal-sensitive transcriptional regulator [Thermaerobacter sp.]|nr:metal-sensitive transcriptional regulator [Thermaerobacter sp.]